MSESAIFLMIVVAIFILYFFIRFREGSSNGASSRSKSGTHGEGDAESPWTEFEGKPNNENVLREKALALAPILGEISSFHADELFNSLSGKIKSNDMLLFLELLFVDLHWVDRFAFEQLGQERRPWLIDPLIGDLIDRLIASMQKTVDRGTFIQEFTSLYNARMNDYRSCSLIPAEDINGGFNFESSLPWVLADKLNIDGDDFDTRMRINIDISNHILSVNQNFNIRKLIGK